MTYPFASYISDILYTEQLDFDRYIASDLNNPSQDSTVMLQLECVAEGGGYGVLPHYIVANDERFIKVLSKQFTFSRSYWLLTRIELNHTF